MRQRLIRIGQALGAIAIALTALWFSGLEPPSWAERLLMGARPPIVIGLLHSQKGAQAINEKSLLDAEMMAVEEINAAGGVSGHPLVALARDYGSDPATAAAMARSLIDEDRASVIFGTWTSEGRKAVQAVVDEKGNLLVFPANYEGMEPIRRTIYMGGTANQSIVPAARWCYDALKSRRFFVVGSQEIWSRSAAEIGKDAARAAGGQVVGEAYLSLAGGGEEAAVAAIKAANPDVVLNMVVGSPNMTLLAALRRAGLSPDKLPSMCFGFAEDELRKFPPGDVAGHYAGMAYFQSLDRPESREFVRKFKAKYGADRAISDPIVAAYNGVILWARAAAESGTDKADAVLTHIDRQSLDAPEGVITIDSATRVTWRPFHVGRARPDGQFDVVYSMLKPIRPSAYLGTRRIGQWQAMLEGFRAGWGGRWSAPASAVGNGVDSGRGATTAAFRTDDEARPE